MATPIEISLANLGNGDLLECAASELRKICSNIADPNCKAGAKRKLQITIEIQPDLKGQMAKISYNLKTTMPGPEAGQTMAYIAMAPESKAIMLYEVETHPNLYEEAPLPNINPLSAKQA